MAGNKELSPRDRAEAFVRTVNMIGKPPASENDEYLQSMVGPGVLIRSFVSGQERLVPEEFADRIRTRVGELLEPTIGTSSYKNRIRDMVNEQLGSQLMRMMGGDFILGTAGISLERAEYGIFEDDPKKVNEAEKAALRMQIAVSQAIMDPQLAGLERRRTAMWIEEYRMANNNEDPRV